MADHIPFAADLDGAYWLDWVLSAINNGQHIDDETVARARRELEALCAPREEVSCG